MQADAKTAVDIAQWIFDAGTTGVLLIGVYAFMKGWIVSAKNFDKALEAQEKAAEQSAEIIASKICDKIEAAVAKGTEQGLVRGYLKLNNGDKKNDRSDT